MAQTDKGQAIVDGSINTEDIYAAHEAVYAIVKEYRELNNEVGKITESIKENWVGKGRNEFESQYNLLIKKMDDFGETLQEIYNALVKAEADYESMDNELKQSYKSAIEG